MSRVRDIANILSGGSSAIATDAEITSAVSNQFVAGKNKIINGDFGVWQRGTSFTNPTDNTYVCDRFKQNGNGSGFTKIWSRQTFTPGAAPISGYESPYFFRFNQTVAGTGGTNNNIGIYVHEDVRTFAGQTVTLSFWAKADSSRSLFLYYGQEFNNSSVGDQYPYISTASLTTTWTRYSFTFTVASISGKTIGSGFTGNFQIVFNANNNITQTIDLWGVQLEAGSTATNFQTATGNPASELAACQRYYVRFGGDHVDQVFAHGFGANSTACYLLASLPVSMRIPSTTLEYSTLGVNDFAGSASTFSSIGISQQSKDRPMLIIQGATGITQYRTYFLKANNSLSSYLAFSSEL